MSQHDMDVANGSGATFRTDMNNALQALASNSVGPLAPATAFPCQWWGDTTAGRLKRRNSANSAWVDMGELDAQSFLLISGGTLTGPINDATPQTIASATTTDIGVATSNVVYISGTTAITGLGTIAAGARRTVKFLASLTLTYNVTSLILPTAASITTAANDTADFLSLGSGNWICLRYSMASGKPPAFTYDRSNILGTVSQSGGIPTGSVIEAGSTANGTFTKFADGRMICTLLALGLGININTAYAGGSIGTSSWAFPAAFVSTPFITLGARGAGKFTATSPADASSSTLGSFLVFDPAGGAYTGSFNCFFLAVGRWF